MVGTALATAKQNAVATQNDNPWLQASSDVNDFDGSYLKLNGNTGEYLAGQAQDEIAAGTRTVVNMDGVKHGWICWKEGEVVDRAMTPVVTGSKPAQSTLADHGPYEKHPDGTQDGWSENHQIPMADETENKYMFQASSASAVTSVKRFYNEYGKKRSQNIDANGNYMLPVVELEVGNFTSKTNKKAGKKFFPILKIVDWVSMADVADLFEAADASGDAPEDYAEAAQETAPAAKRRAAKPKAQPEEAVVEEEVVQEEAVAETPAPAEKRTGFSRKPAEDAPAQTDKATANAAAAAKAADGGRRAKRF